MCHGAGGKRRRQSSDLNAKGPKGLVVSRLFVTWGRALTGSSDHDHGAPTMNVLSLVSLDQVQIQERVRRADVPVLYLEPHALEAPLGK